MAAESDDLLFVEHALRRGLVTEAQVDEIHRIQEKVIEMGVPDSIPSLMVKRGVIGEADADAILAEIRPKQRKGQIPGYRLLRRLGHGGMGSVYLARQTAMDRLVALKVLKPSLTKDPQQIERLRREAQLVGRLSHPNIIRGLDMGESGGFHYFAMEYVEGETLKDHIKSGRPMKEEDALRVVREVAEALDHAWTNRVAHRDIKPGNIFIRTDGRALVMDYGLAKGPIDTDLTQSGSTLGTPQYLSPEQARNPRDVDIRTDIYALGATLYHMLTGRPPYQGDNLAEILSQVILKSPDPAQSLNPHISRNAAFLIDKLMAKDPKHRYQTPRELLRDLALLEKGRSIVPGGWEGDWKAFTLRRRYQRMMFAAVALTVVAAGVIGYAVYRGARSKQEKHLRGAESAEVEARQLEAGASFDGVHEVAKRFREFAEEFRDVNGWFDGRLKVWEKVVAVRNRIRAVDVDGATGELDYETRYQAYAKLAPEAKGLPVVEGALGDRIKRLLEDAKAAAGRAYHEVLDDEDLTLEGLQSDLRRLAVDIDERWPVDGRGEVPGQISARLRHAKHLAMCLGRATKTYDGLKERLSGGRFREARQELRSALSSIDEDAATAKAVQAMPLPVGDGFRRALRDLEDGIVAADESARRSLLAEGEGVLRESNDPAAFDATAAKLRRRAPLALETSEAELVAQASSIEAERKRRNDDARDEFERRMERFRVHLSAERVVLPAERLLEEVEALTDEDGRPRRPWIEDEIREAREDLDRVREFWTRVRASFHPGEPLKKLYKKGSVGGGLGFNSGTVLEMKDPWTLRFQPPTGKVQELRLQDLRLDKFLLASAGLVRGRDELAAIVLWLLEPYEEPDLLSEKERLETLERELRTAETQHFTARYLGEIADRLEALKPVQARREQGALDLYEQARADLKGGRLKAALGKLRKLKDERETYRYTELYRERAAFIDDDIATVQAEMGNEEASARLHGGRFRFLENFERLGLNRARAEIFWPLDRDEERLALGLPESRARLETVPGPAADDVTGVWDPAGPAPVGGVDRRVFALVQGETPEAYLERHPLVIESPFVSSAPMAIEFDLRSPRPLFLAVSLVGFSCCILSQKDRVEGGRGVAFWSGKSFDDLHVRRVFDPLRQPAVRKALEDATPVERMKREETDFFAMEPDRWYRVRCERVPGEFRLRVDGRIIQRWPLRLIPAPDPDRIVILTYTTTLLDNLRIEGTVNSQWWRGR